MTYLNLLKSDQQFYCRFHYYMYFFWGLHFFCYLPAIFKHIEKVKYVERRITQFVSTSKIIYFLE